MTNDLHQCASAYPFTDHIGVFVVDDHHAYRSLLAEVVDATNGFTVLGSAGSWAEARAEFEASDSLPSLVFMDVNLGERSGVDAAREVGERWPDIKVILISTVALADLPDHAMVSASGFLPKSQVSPAQISAAWLGAYDWQR